MENPYYRTLRILRNDLKLLNFHNKENRSTALSVFPRYADIVIIGGGAIGSSIAYFLKHKTGIKGVNVVVVEKDQTVSFSS